MSKGSYKSEQVIVELVAQFCEYRAQNKPKARIPEELRTAVVKAIEAGVPQTQIRKRCGLSTQQIGLWRRRSSAPKSPAASLAPPRVLSLVESSAPQEPVVSKDATTPVIELRCGSWLIAIRADLQAERGR